MSRSDLVIQDEDHARFVAALEDLCTTANASFALLLSPSGQQVAKSGDLNGADATTMASLAAGNVATTEGLAELIGESEFSALFHEGRRNSMHINLISGKLILVLVFGERSSLGLVRLRVEQHTPQLASILAGVLGSAAARAQTSTISPLQQITDEDIESLFA